MQYTIPQFIERESKIVGPFTFKQLVYVGVAGAIALLLWFSTPFYIFLIFSLILGGGALAFSFMKIEGRSLPEIIKNFLTFSSAPKIYLWKKGPPPKLIKKELPKKKEETEEKTTTPKVAGKSKLSKLSTHIETKV